MNEVIDQSKIITAFICSIFFFFFGGYQIIQHLLNFHQPKYQLYIVRIILLVPIYAVQSFLSLLLPESSLIFDTLRDWYKKLISDPPKTSQYYTKLFIFLSYEGYVLYIFTQLMIQYLGGEFTLVSHLELKVFNILNFLNKIE